MAERIMLIFWLDGKTKPGHEKIEKISPGRHVRQNQWKPIWNQYFHSRKNKYPYDYISDYEAVFNHPIDQEDNHKNAWMALQESKRQGTRVPITDLVHFTCEEFADQIVKDNGFKGGKKKINENNQGERITGYFSWWRPMFKEEEKSKIRQHLGKVIEPFIGDGDDLDTLKNQFAASDAFNPQVRLYGEHFFKYSINELIECYRRNYGEVIYKVLGTFAYEQEIMHAVLVCSQANGAGQFKAYPDALSPMEDSTYEAVITRDDEDRWVWRPQATGQVEIIRLNSQEKFPKYRRWEHLAFVFHIPDGPDGIMNVNKPANHRWKIININGIISQVPLTDEDGQIDASE